MNNNSKIDDVVSGQLYFNKYKIQEKLGEGSFGKIYTSINQTNNQQVALKFVINSLLTNRKKENKVKQCLKQKHSS